MSEPSCVGRVGASGLRLDVDLGKIDHNARELVRLCAEWGMTVTAVTKAFLGDPQVAQVLVAAGVVALGDSRIENVERMRDAGIEHPMLLLRSPMPSQIERVVHSGTISVNTDVDVLSALAATASATGRVHEVMLLVELGDLRDGLMPIDLHATVRHVLSLSSLRLYGIGTNLACRHGVVPGDSNMGELCALVDSVEQAFGIEVGVVSGGNSANLGWAAGVGDVGRVNNLRLGESILLGRDPLTRAAIDGLHTDAITFVAEVIESNRKPSQPWGRTGQNAFRTAEDPAAATDPREIWQTIVAAGRQDIDPDDLRAPSGMSVLGASSDHLVLESADRMHPGTEIRFEPGYSALLRAATSPFVAMGFTTPGE